MKNLIEPTGSHAHDSSSSSAISQLAPYVDWRAMGEPEEHFVQFYEADEFLLDSLARLHRRGARRRKMPASSSPRRRTARRWTQRLQATGLDVAAAQATRAVSSRSTRRRLLSKFMSGGQPDAGRFAEVVGVNHLARGGGARRVCASSARWSRSSGRKEITAPRSASKNSGTICTRRSAFSLFCAYPMHGFGGENARRRTGRRLHDALARHPCGELRRAREPRRTPPHHHRSCSRKRVRSRPRSPSARKRRSVCSVSLASGATGARRSRAGQPPQGRISGHRLARAAHAFDAIIGWTHMLRTRHARRRRPPRAPSRPSSATRKSQAQLVEDILDVSRVDHGQTPAQHRAGRRRARSSTRRLTPCSWRLNQRAFNCEVTLDSCGPPRRGRCGPLAAGRLESALERHQVHARRRARRGATGTRRPRTRNSR